MGILDALLRALGLRRRAAHQWLIEIRPLVEKHRLRRIAAEIVGN